MGYALGSVYVEKVLSEEALMEVNFNDWNQK